VLGSIDVDLVTMTGNVAQAIVDPADWDANLRHAYTALRPGGHLVFETRDPDHGAWREWNRRDSYAVSMVNGDGTIESWVELTDVSWPLVTFRSTWVFGRDGQTLTSESTLCFRPRNEIEASLISCGFVIEDVRDAPDRPGRELVFIAARPASASGSSALGDYSGSISWVPNVVRLSK
jgi:hypothetical protein